MLPEPASASTINFEGVQADLIYDNVIRRLDLEQISNFFQKMATHFKGSQISYTAKEGIIINFKTPDPYPYAH